MAAPRLLGALLLAAAVLVAIPRPANAITWTVKSFAQNNATVDNTEYDIYDPSIYSTCTSPGQCKPQTIQVNSNQTWFWCGFRSEKRTEYWFNSSAPVSTLLMRNTEVFGCAVASPSTIKGCGVIDYSVVDTLTNGTVMVVGAPIPDGLCFLIANNGNKNATVTFMIANYYDHARYAGTVISVIILVIFCIGFSAFMVISCVKQYRSPTHRIDELLAYKTPRQEAEEVQELNDGENKGKFHPAIEAKLEEFGERIGSWWSTTVLRRPRTSAPVS